ncbi:hypothetical protein ILUMI_10200 [Ignelater luminosus]|uniref:Transposase Helix-turn-helix domain-containing protein n=1 Tax=Ignelater luminosus TaxID=2038154 RepID=A0A8K0D2H9_IGNLU|nr:hypothetical protein ILUMI_10200 [Ignelater luminosus]
MFSETFKTNSSEWSSVSDEEAATKRRKCVRIGNYVDTVVHKYRDFEFKQHFRMAGTTVYRAIDLFQKSTFVPDSTGGREKISAETSFLLVIWYLSNQGSFREVAHYFDVTFSSAHRCLKRILKFLLSIKSSVIKWPNDEERGAIMEGFRRRKVLTIFLLQVLNNPHMMGEDFIIGDSALCSEIIMGSCVLHHLCIDCNDLIETDNLDFNQPQDIPYHVNLNGPFAEQMNKRQHVFNSIFDIQ